MDPSALPLETGAAGVRPAASDSRRAIAWGRWRRTQPAEATAEVSEVAEAVGLVASAMGLEMGLGMKMGIET